VSKRTFEQDREDVALIQAGDQAAMERFLDAYRGNFLFWSQGWSRHFDAEERLQICQLAALEWARAADPQEAGRARSLLKWQVKQELDRQLFPTLRYQDVSALRSAAASMRDAVSDLDPAPLTLEQASIKYRVDAGLLRNWLSLHGAASVDSLDADVVADAPLLPSQSATELRDRVQLALRELPPKMREVMSRLMDEQDQALICEEMEITSGNFRWLKFEGSSRLRKALNA